MAAKVAAKVAAKAAAGPQQAREEAREAEREALVAPATESEREAAAPAGGDREDETADGHREDEPVDGQLVVGGDFVHHEATGETGGVVVWSGRGWRRLSEDAADGADEDGAVLPPPEGSGIRWGVLTNLGVGVLPWRHASMGLLAAGRFGVADGLAWWRGKDQWEKLHGTGTVRALALVDRADLGLEARRPPPRGPRLEWATTAPTAEVAAETLVEVAPIAAQLAGADDPSALRSRQWESSTEISAAVEAAPAAEARAAEASEAAGAASVAVGPPPPYLRRGRIRYGGLNDAFLLGTVLVVPPLYLAYHALQGRSAAGNFLAPRRRSPPSRHDGIMLRLGDALRKLGALASDWLYVRLRVFAMRMARRAQVRTR